MQRFSPHRLRARREELDLTKTAVAASIDKSYPTYDAYEHGRVTPPLRVLETIAAALACSPADLFEPDGAALEPV